MITVILLGVAYACWLLLPGPVFNLTGAGVFVCAALASLGLGTK